MEQSLNLVERTKQIYAAIENNDEVAITSMFSTQQDIFVIGANQEEWWKGPEAIAKFIQQVKNIQGATLLTTKIEAFENGNTGWVVDQPTFNWNNHEIVFRIALVFIKEDDEWKVVVWRDSQLLSNTPSD